MASKLNNYPAGDECSCSYNIAICNCGKDCKALALGRCPLQKVFEREFENEWRLEDIKHNLKRVFPTYPPTQPTKFKK